MQRLQGFNGTALTISIYVEPESPPTFGGWGGLLTALGEDAEFGEWIVELRLTWGRVSLDMHVPADVVDVGAHRSRLGMKLLKMVEDAAAYGPQ